MAIIELYFVLFTYVIITTSIGNPSAKVITVMREAFSITNFLIASAGYGICKRLDKLIDKK